MTEFAVEGLRHELSSVLRLLDNIAQILRDSQLAQAGADRVSAHARQQLLELVSELNEWTVKMDRELEAVARRTSSLEEDHSAHTEALHELRHAAQISADRLEKLLGIQLAGEVFPLKRDITEVVCGVRELLGKDRTGEPAPWVVVLGKKVGDAFWTSLGTAILLWAFKALVPYIR